MLFSVIYSVDTSADASVATYAPPRSGGWQITESDNRESEYSYLGREWEQGKHRKWCAILTRKQFNAFVGKCNLSAEDVETMGSLGAPGCGFGISPAISFNNNRNAEAICNAYVTPLPAKRNGDPIRANGATERDWHRIRAAVIRKYR